MSYYLKIPVIQVAQPLGVFYICSVRSNVLSELTYPDALTMEGVDEGKKSVYKLSGNQREEIIQKRRQIGQYIDSVEAAFPNTIIIGANVDDNGDPIKDINLQWAVEKDEVCGILYLIIPSKSKNARIVDGQHRLRGFDFSEKETIFDVPCSIYLDLPLSLQASIFATININQKKVDRSLAFELFGYNLDNEPTESWSPEKLAIFFTRKLNVEDDSYLKGHIKVIARFARKVISEANWLIATSVMVDGIIGLISSNPENDRDTLNMKELDKRKRSNLTRNDRSPLRTFYLSNNDVLLYAIVKNYFKAASITLFDRPNQGYIIKTVGIQALFDVLKLISHKAIIDKDISTDYFAKYLRRASNINFEDEFFQASGIGRSRLRNIVSLSCDLINRDKIKAKDWPAYENLLNNRKSDENESRWIWEDAAENRLHRTLETAKWHVALGKVDIVVDEVEEIYNSFSSLKELETRLSEIVTQTARSYMPVDVNSVDQTREDFNPEIIVRSELEDFKDKFEDIGWRLD